MPRTQPGVRLPGIAASLGITERSAHGIVTDLAEACYIVKQKDGRLPTPAVGVGTVQVEVTLTARLLPDPRRARPSAVHAAERHADNPAEADHGRLKAWLWPTPGPKRHRSSRTIAAGYAFGQNPCRGHFDIATAVRNRHRLRVAECCFAGGRDRVYFFGWGRGRRWW